MKRFISIAILLLPALFACESGSETGIGFATSVVLSTDNVGLMVGQTATISATVLPESLGMGVEWSVLDEQYVTVSGGTITARAEGVTYVIATSADGNQKAACMVSVNPPVLYNVSVKDELGQVVNELYGYPGMVTLLSASTTDGEIHSFTWSVEDAAAGSITEDGILTFGSAAGNDAAYAFDVQSNVKVVTEDGFGCKIPFRSSMLRGVKVGEDFYPSGTPVIVEESNSYPVAIMYQGAAAPVAIPADGINVELSDTDDFSMEKAAGMFTLVTGAASDVSTRLSVSPIGSADKVEIAEFVIEKSFPVKALFTDATSSTLSFTWTEGDSIDDDVTKPYTISLYKDAECTELEVSYSIPADDGCWKGRQPKFVFSGLAPATVYWFKVTDTTAGDEKESGVIPATTEAFDIVMVSDTPAAEGDVILAEDFGQLCWGADEISQAAGFDVANSSVAYNTDTKKSFTNREAAMFVGTTSQYAQRSLTAQSTAKKEAGIRFAKWAQGQYARIYVGPGYMFLSTTSYGTHILTPELDNIPEGKTAKLKVTLHAAGKLSGGEAAIAVQHGTSFSEISSGTQTNKNKVDLATNVQTITFSGGITNLEEFEVEIDGVVSGDRIAFGPTTETASSTGNMMILSDFTVQIVELK